MCERQRDRDRENVAKSVRVKERSIQKVIDIDRESVYVCDGDCYSRKRIRRV